MDKLNKNEFLKNLKPTSPQQIHDKLLNLTENALKVCKQNEKKSNITAITTSTASATNPESNQNTEKNLKDSTIKTAENDTSNEDKKEKENIPSESIMDCLHLLKFIDTDNSNNIQEEQIKQRNIKGFDLDEVTSDFINDSYGFNSSQEIILNNLELSSDNDYIYNYNKLNDFFPSKSNYMKQSEILNQTIAISRFIYVGYKTKIHQKEIIIEDIEYLKKLLINEIDQEAILLSRIYKQVKLNKQKNATIPNNKNTINETNNIKETNNNNSKETNNINNNNNETTKKITNKNKSGQNETISLIEKNYPVPKSKLENINFLHKPYSTEKHRNLVRKPVEKSDYFLESLKYTEFINEITNENIKDIIIKIYTFEGFIYKRINWLLKNKKELYTNLNIFYLLLLGSISSKSELTKNTIEEKDLWFVEKKLNKQQLEFYRGTFLDDVAINYFIDNLSKKKVKIFIFI